jgi:hypothetical protein
MTANNLPPLTVDDILRERIRIMETSRKVSWNSAVPVKVVEALQYERDQLYELVSQIIKRGVKL